MYLMHTLFNPKNDLPLSFFLEKYLFLHVPVAAMAGVLEHLKRPWLRRPREEHRVFPSYGIDRKVLELETAKEILCEVFGVVPGDVEEMIRQRLGEREAL
ncbi:Uncharacterised protein [uncultured archaeon]|nr:Uncharacterised protein [uncultured archaeon]